MASPAPLTARSQSRSPASAAPRSFAQNSGPPSQRGGARRPISQMGTLVPEPERAAAILADFASYSAPFGLEVVTEEGVGVVRIES